MAAINYTYSNSINDGLLMLLHKIQNKLQLPQAHVESWSTNRAFVTNASIEYSTVGDWVVPLASPSDLNLHETQLKTIFSKTSEIQENVHIQITATSNLDNVNCFVDGFIPQFNEIEPMDLILNVRTQETQQSLPVQRLLTLSGFGLDTLPLEFPVRPGMVFLTPPKSCTIALRKSKSDSNWSVRLLTFQMTLEADWVVVPGKITCLASGIELHIKQNHQMISSGTVVIGSNQPQQTTMTISGDEKAGNGLIVFSLVQGSIPNVWSELVDSKSTPQFGTMFPSGTLVVSCQASPNKSSYEILEVDFKFPFPLPHPDPTLQLSSATQHSYLADSKTSSNSLQHTKSSESDISATVMASDIFRSLPSAGAAVVAGAASEPAYRETHSSSSFASGFPTYLYPPVQAETANSWAIANQGDWVLLSPTHDSIRLSTNPQSFDLQKPPLQLRPDGIGALITEKRDFKFSFTLSVNSAIKISFYIIDTKFTGLLQALWEPESGSSNRGSLRWFQKDRNLSITTGVIDQSHPTTLKFYYSYSSRKNWSLVVFQDDAYVTNVETDFDVLTTDWSPDPGVTIALKQKAAVEINAGSLTSRTNEISGPIS